MIEQIANAFPHSGANKCHEIQKGAEFHIYDSDEGKSKICENEEPHHFSVVNPNEKSISFLAIDKCLISDSERGMGRCDCAVFDDSTFCFVEIKAITTENANSIDAHRKKSRDQLLNTIRRFKSVLNFHNFQIEAFIAIGPANTPTLQKALTTDLNTKVKFEEIGAIFYKGNVKRFE